MEEDWQWMLSQAKACQKTNDLFGAKSWLISCKSLFPSSFEVQLFAYNFEKECKNFCQASVVLTTMLEKFAEEGRLWQLLKSSCLTIFASSDQDSIELKEILNQFSDEERLKLLTATADNCVEIGEKCKLKLLILQNYPDTITTHGIELVNTLENALSNPKNDRYLMEFESLLACSVVPLILKSDKIHFVEDPDEAMEVQEETSSVVYLSTSSLYNWLELSIRYFLLIKRSGSGTAHYKDVVDTVVAVSSKAGWSSHEQMEHCFQPLLNGNVEECWKLLHDVLEAAISKEEILYTYLVLLCYAAYHYVYNVTGAFEMEEGSNLGISPNSSLGYVLLESIFEPSTATENADEESSYEQQNHQASEPGFYPFLAVANKCWKVLSNSQYRSDFRRIRRKIHFEYYFTTLRGDMLIYEGDYEGAIKWIQSYLGKTDLEDEDVPQSAIRFILQLASCLLCKGDYKEGCKCILKFMTLYAPVNQLQSWNGHDIPIDLYDKTGNQKRLIQFIRYVDNNLTKYCIEQLLYCLQKSAFKNNDMAMGHTIVLSQYDWPDYTSYFDKVAKMITSNGQFSYPSFFDYVINIDILEVFAHFHSAQSSENSRIRLALLARSSSATRTRTITRGLNKGAKEEFRVAMERQILKWNDCLNELLQNFLTSEQESILSCF